MELMIEEKEIQKMTKEQLRLEIDRVEKRMKELEHLPQSLKPLVPPEVNNGLEEWSKLTNYIDLLYKYYIPRKSQ